MIVLNRACASADISLIRMTVSALIAVSFASCALATDYCSNIQNLPPLVDLGPGQTYQGYEGGLYPGGSNVRPGAHDAAGRKIAQSIVPLDANGDPDHVNGKIVYTIESSRISGRTATVRRARMMDSVGTAATSMMTASTSTTAECTRKFRCSWLR